MRPTFSLFASLLLCACTSATPQLNESTYARDQSAGFMLNEGYFRYAIRIELTQALTPPISVRVEYENPTDPESPMIQSFTHGDGRVLVVESPPVTGLRYRQVYTVLFRFDNDPAKSHTTQVQYNLPPELEQQALKGSSSDPAPNP